MAKIRIENRCLKSRMSTIGYALDGKGLSTVILGIWSNTSDRAGFRDVPCP